jgi:hypothetical protein
VLLVFLTAATTEVEEDMTLMSGPLGALAEVQQQQPPKLKKMLMVGSLAGVLSVFLAAATTEVEEDVDGGPLGGDVGISGSSHHRS